MIGGNGVRVFKSNNTDLNGVLVFTAKCRNAAHIYARGFMIVMKDGVSQTIYSDEILDLSYNP